MQYRVLFNICILFKNIYMPPDYYSFLHCISKKFCPILYRNLLYEMGQNYLDTQYVRCNPNRRCLFWFGMRHKCLAASVPCNVVNAASSPRHSCTPRRRRRRFFPYFLCRDLADFSHHFSQIFCVLVNADSFNLRSGSCHWSFTL